MNGNHYVIVNIRVLDPVAGRGIINHNDENIDFTGEGMFIKPDASVWPKK